MMLTPFNAIRRHILFLKHDKLFNTLEEIEEVWATGDVADLVDFARDYDRVQDENRYHPLDFPCKKLHDGTWVGWTTTVNGSWTSYYLHITQALKRAVYLQPKIITQVVTTTRLTYVPIPAVHYSQQPNLKVYCCGKQIILSWGSPTETPHHNVYEAIYEQGEKILYTFDESKVTCKECLEKMAQERSR